MEQEAGVRRGPVKIVAASLLCLFWVSAAAPAAAFETYWFTQRGKNLRAGTGAEDDPYQRPAQRQRAAPFLDRCGGQGRDANGQPRRGEGCQ